MNSALCVEKPIFHQLLCSALLVLNQVIYIYIHGLFLGYFIPWSNCLSLHQCLIVFIIVVL